MRSAKLSGNPKRKDPPPKPVESSGSQKKPKVQQTLTQPPVPILPPQCELCGKYANEVRSNSEKNRGRMYYACPDKCPDPKGEPYGDSGTIGTKFLSFVDDWQAGKKPKGGGGQYNNRLNPTPTKPHPIPPQDPGEFLKLGEQIAKLIIGFEGLSEYLHKNLRPISYNSDYEEDYDDESGQGDNENDALTQPNSPEV